MTTKKEIDYERKAKLEVEKIRHENRMTEIEEERKAKIQVENKKFDNQKQIQRIRNADIQRAQLRKY